MSEDKDRPPRDLTLDDLAVIRSVGVMCRWRGRLWRWDGSDWQSVDTTNDERTRT